MNGVKKLELVREQKALEISRKLLGMYRQNSAQFLTEVLKVVKQEYPDSVVSDHEEYFNSVMIDNAADFSSAAHRYFLDSNLI